MPLTPASWVQWKMEERNRAWAKVVNLSELRNTIKRAIDASAYAPDPVTFEVSAALP